jgi:hypothetical protein
MSVQSVVNTTGRTIYELAFQISPIIFTNGIASNFLGFLPIICITETGYDFSGSTSLFGATGLGAAGALATSVRNAMNTKSLDDFFAQFTVVPGGTITRNSIGQYPFANQSVAANAIISEPLNVSLRMSIPVNKPGGHTAKLVTMQALQSAVQSHTNLGGTYTILTPAHIYTNCLLVNLTDVSSNHPIAQNAWQFDFVQPLVTLEQANNAMYTFFANTQAGLPTPVPGQ